jgi:deoxyribose-phosphate aldolase
MSVSGPQQSETGRVDPAEVASKIQSTLISNQLSRFQWERHISDCLAYKFHAAMVPGAWVRSTAEALRDSGVKVASFVDIPLGTMTSPGKAFEAERLVRDGAAEIDLMPNVGFLLCGMEKEYFDDIHGVVEAIAPTPVKVMLELPLLDQSQRTRAVQLSLEAGVVYLKNASSGAVGIAKPEDIRFLRQLAPPNVGVKASGGIKTWQQVEELLEAGADLVGTSAASQIMEQVRGVSSQGTAGDDY